MYELSQDGGGDPCKCGTRDEWMDNLGEGFGKTCSKHEAGECGTEHAEGLERSRYRTTTATKGGEYSRYYGTTCEALKQLGGEWQWSSSLGRQR